MLTRTLAALAALLLLTFTASCSKQDDGDDDAVGTDPSTEQTTDATDEPTDEAGACTYAPDGQEPLKGVTPPPAEPEYDGNVSVVMKTTVGDLNIVLDAKNKPCTVGSFLSLAGQDYFDDSPCPRLGSQPGFGILQCGDPSGTGSGGPGYSVQDELTGKETYPAGTIAMANTGSPDTNGSQFFLVFADSQFPPSYTTFGTLDASSIRILQGVAAKGDDGSHPAGGGAPNQKVDIQDVTIR